MLNLNTIMIGSKDPKKLSEFYEKVIGKPPDWSDGTWSGWMMGNVSFTIGEHSEVSDKVKEPQRVIFNFDADNVQKEFTRIKELGATVIKEPYSMSGDDDASADEDKMWIATLSDPDGNYFQLTTPWRPDS